LTHIKINLKRINWYLQSTLIISNDGKSVFELTNIDANQFSLSCSSAASAILI